MQYAVRMNDSIDVRVEPAAPIDRTLLANLLELWEPWRLEPPPEDAELEGEEPW